MQSGMQEGDFLTSTCSDTGPTGVAERGEEGLKQQS